MGVVMWIRRGVGLVVVVMVMVVGKLHQTKSTSFLSHVKHFVFARKLARLLA